VHTSAFMKEDYSCVKIHALSLMSVSAA